MDPDKRCQLILLKFPQPLGILMFMARLLCLLPSLLTSTHRSRLSLQLEIAALRHQLSTYRVKGQRLQIGPADRLLWCVIAELWSQWRKALFFVQPRTVTLWQQTRFRDYWRAPCQSNQPVRSHIAPGLQKLIKRLWQANPTWGSPRIVAELQKLGIEVAKSTVEKYKFTSSEGGRIPWNRWQLSNGMGGSFAVESVAGFARSTQSQRIPLPV